MNYKEYDYKRMQRDLIENLGAATFGPFPAAGGEFLAAQLASTPQEILEVAERNGLNISNYEILDRDDR